jgi:peptidoglycan hydrolase-like protein with peptidoglycan-binding domain
MRILLSTALGLSLCLAPVVLRAQSSDEIRQAQQALKDKGLDPGAVDGVDGPKTKSATRKFQKQQNLAPDGRLGPQTLDSLGVKHGTAGTQMHEAGSNIKHSYGNGGKSIGQGSKEMGSDVKHGEVVAGAKDFGKGIGKGAKDIGVGTGHAAKNVAKGVKNAVTPDKKKSTEPAAAEAPK